MTVRIAPRRVPVGTMARGLLTAVAMARSMTTAAATTSLTSPIRVG